MRRAQDGTTRPGTEDPVVVGLRHFVTSRPEAERGFTAPDVAACDTQGMLGALWQAAQRGSVALSPDAEAMLATLLERVTAEAVILESRTATAIGALTESGIPARVLKGVAAAQLDYEDPLLRHFGDIDLLVRGEDMDAAVRSFRAHGYRRHFPEPFDGFDEFVGKGVAMSDESGTVFDLHRTLALGYYGTRLPVEDLWREAEAFEIAGQTMAALQPRHRFVHGALHLALAPSPRMANGLDLVMVAQNAPEIVTTDLVEIAERWGCAFPMALAVMMTADWFGDDWAPSGLVEWSRSRRPTTVDRIAMSTFGGRLSNSRLRSLTAVAGLRSGAERRRALRGLFMRGHHEHE